MTNKRVNKKRMTKAERKKQLRKKRRKRMAVIMIEALLLLLLGAVAYGMFKLDKLDINVLNKNKLEAYRDTGPYTNIALFGLDSRDGEIDGGVQSDSIIIASINNDTQDVTLTSIYRDTLLQQADGTYEKANSAYTMGGPEEAISMLNRNFDLDIQNYASVNFNALVDIIDALGGLEIEMTQEEAWYCNGYAAETAQVVGQEMIPIEEEAGVQLLDGVHAVAYARIRYTEGDDFKRAERQRFVLSEIAKKAKKANILTLNKIIDKVFPQVSTSFTMQDMLGFAANALKYNIKETTGFPYQVTTSEEVIEHDGSYVVPIAFADDVMKLHQNLFAETDYEPSDKVWEVHNDIAYLGGITDYTEAMQTDFGGDIHNAENQ